jgi:hypothetical protein
VLQNWGSISLGGATFTTEGLDAALSVDTSELATTGAIMVIPEPTAISLLSFAALLTLVICRLCRRHFSYVY